MVVAAPRMDWLGRLSRGATVACPELQRARHRANALGDTFQIFHPDRTRRTFCNTAKSSDRCLLWIINTVYKQLFVYVCSDC